VRDSTPSIAEFNKLFPPQPAVQYYSLAGRSNSALAEAECVTSASPAFVSVYNGIRDPIDPLLFLSSRIIGRSLLDPDPNDGIVEVRSAPFGTWLGCIPADHWDQIGQLLGDSPGSGNTFDHLQFYQQLAAFLVQQGF
jgi:triacylglycerol lipase